MLNLSQIITELRRRGCAIGNTKEERQRERTYDTVFSIVCATIFSLTCVGLLYIVWSKTTVTQRTLGFAAIVGSALLLCSWRFLSRFLPAFSKVVRVRLQLAVIPVIMAWMAIYINFIFNDANAIGSDVVALVSAMMIPSGLLVGLAYGLEEACRRQADATVS